ncbi:hypothetical protein UFOVP514_34 [uncultured Caudovirales phage]|jgi:hypothetical protein|uniref:Uncharacterized protein n=1 Tax=uncultured Caudovirales phage TaxID=2100421 RepID=A0A6J5MV75_9CAUD|nr:hypothetical protein UFOVP514_34 [uncultured Caudovirales phage]
MRYKISSRLDKASKQKAYGKYVRFRLNKKHSFEEFVKVMWLLNKIFSKYA